MPEPGAKWGKTDEIANFLAQPSDFGHISCSTWTLRLLAYWKLLQQSKACSHMYKVP